MLCPQMPLRAKAMSKKLDAMSSFLTYKGEAETRADKALPIQPKNLFSHHPFPLDPFLFSHLKEKYTLSVKNKEKGNRISSKKPQNLTKSTSWNTPDLLTSDPSP